MKKTVVSIFLTICLALMLVGCGDKNNSATAPTNSPETSARPAGEDGNNASASPTGTGDMTDDNGMDNDKDGGLSNDIKEGADDIGDGVKDAVDGAEDGVKDAVDGAKDAVDGAMNDAGNTTGR